MSILRFCACLVAISMIGTPAFSKNETLAERGKRMCEEAGVSLEDCTILPPALRDAGDVAAVTPEPRPVSALGAGPSAYGTGKYGWCEDCTSLLAAAPVKPWAEFSGRQYEPNRDEDEGSNRNRRSASRSDTAGDDGDGGQEGEGDDGGNGGDGDDDGNDGDGDDGGNGGDGDDGDGDDGGNGDDGDDGGNGGDKGGHGDKGDKGDKGGHGGKSGHGDKGGKSGHGSKGDKGHR